LLSYRRNILKPLGLAEGAHKASALAPRSAKPGPLGKNDSPGKYAEPKKNQENNFGNQTAVLNEINDLVFDNAC
jgi:hypothetical protein